MERGVLKICFNFPVQLIFAYNNSLFDTLRHDLHNWQNIGSTNYDKLAVYKFIKANFKYELTADYYLIICLR